MSVSHLDFLRHILDEINFISANIPASQSEFYNDEKLKRAFVRSLEIIGEATKKLPSEFKEEYPYVEWRKIGATRDKLIHHYFGVDYEIVWDIITNELNNLKEAIERILEENT